MDAPVLKSFDVATGEELGSVPTTAVGEVPTVVRNGLSAAKPWSRLPAIERAQLVQSAGSLLAHRTEELTELLCREMGKIARKGFAEVKGTLSSIPHLTDEVVAAIAPEHRGNVTVEYRPLGVVAVISPWNYPLAMANNLVIPALIAGNTVVLKPSEHTPLVAQAYVDAFSEVLPPNVLQIVHGDSEQGTALVQAEVSMVAFTGSQSTGRDVMRKASAGIKRLVMELGGNDPMIVLHDADLPSAARFAVANSFENAGQMCTSTERIYVDRRVADAFERLVVGYARRYRMGPWNDPAADIFPINNKTQRTNIISHIEDAVAQGARVLLGAQDHPPRYVRPTVLADVHRNARMEHEETFGPVVSIASFVEEQQAIEWANDSTYGLGAVVFGGASARVVAAQLEAGMVGINGGVGAGGMWVGAKQSGLGFHGGTEGHRLFTQIRVTA